MARKELWGKGQRELCLIGGGGRKVRNLLSSRIDKVSSWSNKSENGNVGNILNSVRR